MIFWDLLGVNRVILEYPAVCKINLQEVKNEKIKFNIRF